jgi:hypothetical protein
MIKHNEIVTKKFLAEELTLLRNEMRTEMREQKYYIIREVRSIMHETMMTAMENMKSYYEISSAHYMKALIEGVRDEIAIYKIRCALIRIRWKLMIGGLESWRRDNMPVTEFLLY